jgi:hypothetical protein
MERRPDSGAATGPEAGTPAADPSSSAAGSTGARVLAFPRRYRAGGPPRDLPAPRAREVAVRFDPASGRVELFGVEAPSAADALLPFGLRPAGDGRWEGAIARGDFRLLLATWSDLLEEAWRGPRPKPVPAPAGFRERPRNTSAHAASARDFEGGCAICGRRPVRILDAGLELADSPDLVCPACDARAQDADGRPLAAAPDPGGCPNPVFVDGRRCWRLYRFGGWITLLDRDDVPSLADLLGPAPGRPPPP